MPVPASAGAGSREEVALGPGGSSCDRSARRRGRTTAIAHNVWHFVGGNMSTTEREQRRSGRSMLLAWTVGLFSGVEASGGRNGSLKG